MIQEKLNFYYMGTAVVRSVRAYKRYEDKPGLINKLIRKYWRLSHFFWSVVTSSHVGLGATIGQRVSLPHPIGVVVHANSIIGDDCMIMQQVTIGQLDTNDVPVVGARVYIGAGAKILGKVKIGDGARIGANAVVLEDVADGWTAVGVPARLIPPSDSRSQDRKLA
jgi:serine O-acetyltransferase